MVYYIHKSFTSDAIWHQPLINNLPRKLHHLITSMTDSYVESAIRKGPNQCFMEEWRATLLFSFLFCESIIFLLTFKGALYTLSRGDPLRDAMIGSPESLPTLSPRGWKYLPSQLVVVTWPRLLERKAIGGSGKAFTFLIKETDE